MASGHELAELAAAAEAIESGKTPEIEVNGTDEGDMLSNVLGALEVRTKVDKEGEELRTALRNFAERVRDIIQPE